jgi:hypothetical protein
VHGARRRTAFFPVRKSKKEQKMKEMTLYQFEEFPVGTSRQQTLTAAIVTPTDGVCRLALLSLTPEAQHL